MKRWWINALSILVAGALTITVTGCGDDDDKGTGTSDLSTEEQYEIITKYFSLDPDNDSAAIDVTGIALGLLSGEYWDGVDTSDIIMTAQRLVPNTTLAKRAAHGDDSLDVDYDFVTGWWAIFYRVDLSSEFGDFELTFRDSVRFQDAEGHPQMEPDVTTSRLDLIQDLTSHVSGLNEGLAAHGDDHFDLTTSVDSRFAALRTAFDTAQVDGDAGVTFTLDASANDTAAVIGFEFDASFDEVSIPLEGTGDGPCPSDGDISATLDIAVSLEAGDETAEAEGTWDASIDFTGDGNADVDVQSGDFTKSYSGQVCGEPLL
jgi:hypothetical protein